jgi:hypothetical protein
LEDPVRTTVVLLALLTTGATRGQAQKAWQTEFGFQGGFTRLVEAGSGGDPTDVFSIPGFNLGNVLPSTAGLFAIIPWSKKLAVETDFAVSQFSFGATVTLLSVGVRGDYALTKHAYAAGGGSLAYNNGLANETQLGVQGALGYRFSLTSGLNARFEGRVGFFGKAENAPPVDAYSVVFGVSKVTARGRTTRSPAAHTPGRQWTTQIGISGGYADVHLIGAGSVTAMALPGYGGALGNAFGATAGQLRAITLPPTVFAVFPLGNRVALEPAIDIHHFNAGGQTDFSGNLSVRLDLAVHGGWYGALGGNLHYIKSTGIDASTRTGLNLGWGYRFPLTHDVGGRMEANYTMFPDNTTYNLPPTNTLGLMFGLTLPVK